MKCNWQTVWGGLLYIVVIFFATTVHAQPPTGKCISGDCMNGYGTYQLNLYSYYEGNFKNGSFSGSGKLYNPDQWDYQGIFGDGLIENCNYKGRTYKDRSYHLVFAGRCRINTVSRELAQQNWQTVNYHELNGTYFTIQYDSGKYYLDPFYSDTAICFVEGKFNDKYHVYGPGKVYGYGNEVTMDFGTGKWVLDDAFVSNTRYAVKSAITVPWQMAKCISGDCMNGRGIARLNAFSTYEGGFKNGHWYGQGKVKHDSNAWYYTGFFNQDTIKNYAYYSTWDKNKEPALYMRARKIPVIYHDQKFAEDNWTRNNFNVLNGKFFVTGQSADTVIYYFKPDFRFIVLPGSRRAILSTDNKYYGFMINPDKPYWTEDILREHLVRGKYATNRTYIYYPDIYIQPDNIPPFADNKPVVKPNNTQPANNGLSNAELRRLIEGQQLELRDKLVLKPGYELIDKGFFGNDTRVTTTWLPRYASYSLFISFPTGDKFEILDNDGNPCDCDVFVGSAITDVTCLQRNNSQYTDQVKFKYTIRVLKGNGPFYFTTFRKVN